MRTRRSVSAAFDIRFPSNVDGSSLRAAMSAELGPPTSISPTPPRPGFDMEFTSWQSDRMSIVLTRSRRTNGEPSVSVIIRASPGASFR